jgi:hypothetical protein
MNKNFTFIIFSFFQILALHAQTYFGDPYELTGKIAGAKSVYTIDIDGDGDPDLLTASSRDNKIAWYENTDGNGTFGEQQIITTNTDGAWSVYSCDIDGDGDMDVLSASYNDDKIAWYENTDGKGSFGEQQLITGSANGAIIVRAGDLDGDGDMDILSASDKDDKVAWYENTDGNGTFSPQKIITTLVDKITSIYVCDIDGDRDPDILSGSFNDDKLAWYENTDGTGTFGSQQIISTDANGPSSIIACDVDGDGDMDVLSASSNDQLVAWYENTNGTGTFGSQQYIVYANNPKSIYAADIDLDGDQDLLVASYGGDIVVWMENKDGAGNFGSTHVISTGVDRANVVYACDIDADTDIDVFAISAGDDRLAWYENTDGSGSFGPRNFVVAYADRVNSVFACDINGDGDQDLLSASSDDNMIAWYENTDGNGSFGEQKIITTLADYAIDVFGCDLDGDGDNDVVSASFHDNKIAWYENTDGNGTFGPQQVITTSASCAFGVFACDIDGDSDMDVLSASALDDKIAWYENTDGKGAFGPQQVITTEANYATAVYACDIDGDSDMDVISSSADDAKVAWYENTDGKGMFGPQQVIDTIHGSALSVYAGDYDGDGDIDVLSKYKPEQIVWYKNTDGSGSFSEPQIVTTTAQGPTILRSYDLDNDGDLDILTNSRFNKVVWYQNVDGMGNFSEQKEIALNVNSPSCVHGSDINGDGNIDVIMAARGDDKITWLKNFTLKFIEQPESITISCGSNTSFSVSTIYADSYQWQVNQGAGFNDLTNSSIYSGATENTMQITNAASDISGYQFRCVATNADGSRISDTATLTIHDSEKPVITSSHTDQSLDADANCEATLPDYTGAISASDNCDPDPDITQSPSAGTTISGNINTVTLTVTDNAGNSSEVTFNVEVIDTEAPTISCVENQSFNLTSGITVYSVNGTGLDPVSTDDNCGIASVVNDFTDSQTLNGAQFPGGTTHVTWTATDESGNTAKCSFDVTVHNMTRTKKIKSGSIAVYPNPTNEILYLDTSGEKIRNVKVFDLTGNLLIDKNDMTTGNVNLSQLSNGVYLIHVIIDNASYTIRIVKE